MAIKRLLASGLLAVGSGATLAEDDQGRFAVKGIGATDCATFVTEADKRGSNAFMYGGWVYGYLTASNKATPGTFDLVAWENLETLTGYLYSYCREHPKESFAQAVFQLSEALRPDRIAAASEPLEVKAGRQAAVVYPQTLRRVQDRLKALGLYAEEISGVFDAPTEKALQAFQRARGLTVSGLPDQPTLHALLRDK